MVRTLSLEDAETYLPQIHLKIRHFESYPDGDFGETQTVVGSGGPGTWTFLTFVESDLHPDVEGDPLVTHYFLEAQGITTAFHVRPQERTLWLPKELWAGKRWRAETGQFEVLQIGEPLDVGQHRFERTLSYRQRIPEMDFDQTVWLAPRLGKVQVKDNVTGQTTIRFLGEESLTPDGVRDLLELHAPGEVRP